MPIVDPLARWRLLIKAMGGATGAPAKNLLTFNATTTTWQQSATTSIVSPYPSVTSAPAGGPWAVEPVVIPFDPVHQTGGSFWKLIEGPNAGQFVSYWSNSLGYGNITVAQTSNYDRGPGATIATIEYPAAHAAGALLRYNDAGGFHATFLADDPNLQFMKPKRTHYAIEFWNGTSWDEVFAGMIWDFSPATDNQVVVAGVDYLGLYRYMWDERFDPKAPDRSAPTGSKYVDMTITDILTAQLTYAKTQPNSIVGFINIGTIEPMTEKVTIFSTMQNSLDFAVGLINSHRAGTGKMTRISVDKVAGVYTLNIRENPGVRRDDLALNYIAGGLVQGYQAIPFGTDWASRVNLIGRSRDGAIVDYKADSSAVDQNTWGRIGQAPVVTESADKNDLARRARQAALDAAKLGRQLGIGLKLGSFRPLQSFDIPDMVPVAINHGAVKTGEWGSDDFASDPAGNPSAVEALYWSIVGIVWESYDDGHWETKLGLWPTGGGSSLPQGTKQALLQNVYWNSNPLFYPAIGRTLPHAILPVAPSEGSLLVAMVAANASPGTPPPVINEWTLQATGFGFDNTQYGGPGAPAYLWVYTRIAVANEDTFVLPFDDIGSGLWDPIIAYLLEIPNGVVKNVTLVDNQTMVAGTLNAVSATTDAGQIADLYLIVVTQKTDYSPTDTWTPTVGTMELVEQDGPSGASAHAPGFYVASKTGTGLLTASATKDINPGLDRWGYVKVGLLIGTPSNISIANPITPPTPLALGSGPPPADNTGSRTYTDLTTGQQYVRNDNTNSWDPVPGTRLLVSEPGVLLFGTGGEDGADSFVPGSRGATGQQGPPGLSIPGLDGDDGADSFVPGPPGTTGSTGAVGATGATGAAGATGAPGLDGEDGETPMPSHQQLHTHNSVTDGNRIGPEIIYPGDVKDVRIYRSTGGRIIIDGNDAGAANAPFVEVQVATGHNSGYDNFALKNVGDSYPRISVGKTSAGLPAFKMGGGAGFSDAEMRRTGVGAIELRNPLSAGAVAVNVDGILTVLGVPIRPMKQKVQVFTSSGNWTRPAGVDVVEVFAVGGGGGGGGSSATSSGAGGGGGGGIIQKQVDVTATPIGNTIAVSVGAGGNGGANTPTDGTNGSNTTFGALVTAFGGGGGGHGASARAGLSGGCGGGASNTVLRTAAGGGGALSNGVHGGTGGASAMGGKGSQGGNGGWSHDTSLASGGGGGLGFNGFAGGGGGGGSSGLFGLGNSGGGNGGNSLTGGTGTANTGGGGGGSGANANAAGGAGGSGYLEVRWVE